MDQRLKMLGAKDELGWFARTVNEAFDNYVRRAERVDQFSLNAAHPLGNLFAAQRITAASGTAPGSRWIYRSRIECLPLRHLLVALG